MGETRPQFSLRETCLCQNSQHRPAVAGGKLPAGEIVDGEIGWNSQEMQNRRNQVARCHWFVRRICALLVRSSIDLSTADSAASQQNRLHMGPMIASRHLVNARRSAELSETDNQGVV